MPKATAAELVRDRLIEHDIAMRRFIAGHEREITQILRRMESLISAAVTEIDVAGARGPRRQAARMAKLEKRVEELMQEAYAEIRRLHRDAQIGAARATSRAIITAIEESGDVVS